MKGRGGGPELASLPETSPARRGHLRSSQRRGRSYMVNLYTKGNQNNATNEKIPGVFFFAPKRTSQYFETQKFTSHSSKVTKVSVGCLANRYQDPMTLDSYKEKKAHVKIHEMIS